jgi:putative membrane protein
MSSAASSRSFRTHPSLLLSWIVLAAFTVVFLARGNREFLLYAATLSVLIALVQRSDRVLAYAAGVKWCFLFWLVLHMCGGYVHVGATRLYDLILLPLAGAPYHVLRYDQFVHAFCYFMIGGLLSGLVAHMASPRASPWLQRLVVLLAALGVGAINEIIEFSAVACFGTDGVGDYFNNALDNVFNALGAIAALVWPARNSDR